MATTEQPAPNIGARKLRKEDPELIMGSSRFTDDITVPGMLWLGFVRSPFAHARYGTIDVSKALAMDGVVAAYTAADLEFAAPLFMAFPLRDLKQPPHWPLAKDKARYAGDPVAVVVAESRALAVDAAEAVSVELGAAAGRDRRQGRPRGRRAARPRRPRHQQRRDVGLRARLARPPPRRPGPLLRGPRPRQGHRRVLPGRG